jgi:hypothetical protein
MTGKAAIHYAAMLSSAVAVLVVARVAVAQDSAKSGAPNYAALVAAPDRTDADRQTDQRRDPLHVAPLPLLASLERWRGRLRTENGIASATRSVQNGLKDSKSGLRS